MQIQRKNILTRIWNFYYWGFRNMGSWDRQAWLIILIKLFIMFVILRIFFFRDFLKTNFNTDKGRSEYVLENLTKTK